MRRVAGVLVAAMVSALALTTAGSEAGSGSGEVVAEFETARGLVEGNDVRIAGAPAGTVDSLELSDHGTALVTLSLHEGLAALHDDASAAIRPVDLIGDNYVSLDPGEGAGVLDGTIPLSRTVNAPRLDDLLRTFTEPERLGLQATLVEAGMALDRRGADLNDAILAARPALQATDDILVELGSQNADLRSFVENAESVTSQAATKSPELRTLVGGLAATLDETSAHDSSLADTLEAAPQGLDDVEAVSARLSDTVDAATPLAESLNRSAPGLAQAATSAGPFLDELTSASGKVRPAIRELADLLDGGEETFTSLSGSLGDVVDTAPSLDAFMDVIAPAAPDISEGFFKNFPDQAAEPGTQPFDPFADSRRHYWRGAALLTCQSFGRPIEPGCLQDFLAKANAHRSASPQAGRVHESSAGERDEPGAGAGPVPGEIPTPDQVLPQSAQDDLLDFLFR